MPEEINKKYLLTIKRDNNDYLPLEWHRTNAFEGENLFTLEGIDKFTGKQTRPELLSEALKANMVDSDEKYESFAIIYYEKGKTRELKDGTVFEEDDILSEENFIQYIIDNLDDKLLMNQLYNACFSKTTEPKLEEFKFIIKNIDLFKTRGKNALYAALSIFKEISYVRRRHIIIKISKKIVSKTNINTNDSHLSKKEIPNYDGKVA